MLRATDSSPAQSTPALAAIVDRLPSLFEEATTVGSDKDYARFKDRYHDRPDLFIRECFTWKDGEGPTPYQLEIVTLLAHHRRIAIRGPHGLGKTAMAAQVLLWFALTRDGDDWKIPTTASAWRQLTKYLWPEVKKWIRRLDWEKIGRKPFATNKELFTLNLKLETGEAFAVATNDAESIEGAHASSSEKGRGGILYIFDEAKIIPPEMWDSAEGAFSTDNSNTFWLAISTPGDTNGRFYDIHARKDGYHDWVVRHVTKEEAIAAGRMSAKWAEDRRRQWHGDERYQNRVEGNFARSRADAIIPLEWIELANERWYSLKEVHEEFPSQLRRIGADIAHKGADSTVLCLEYDSGYTELRKYPYADTMQTAGYIHALLIANPEAVATVEVVGVGAGTYDKLREVEAFVDRVYAFNPSARTDFVDRSGEWSFVDTRSAAWWSFREMLDPANNYEKALPPDDALTGDLMSPTWRVMSNGRIRVESKQDIRARIGKSTDEGDSAVIANWNPEPVEAGMEFA